MAGNPRLSVVSPFLNEEEVLPLYIEEITKVCREIDGEYEVILVDDGSTDATYKIMKEASQRNSHIKVIKFSRNFGHQAAFSAGVDFASGDMVVTMDGDLQNPPRLIHEFIKFANEGYDMVIGDRTSNEQNSWMREFIGRVAYKVLRMITGLDFKNASDFGLYNRRVVETMKKMPEKERFMRGIFQWVGYKKKYVPYVSEARKGGEPKYNFRKLFSLGLSGLTSFSAFPLRLSFWFGFIVLIASFIFGIYIVINHYVNPVPAVSGFATIVILVLFLGSVQLMVLGVIGEYLYKMFNEIKGRPFYIVSEVLNVEDKNLSSTPYGISPSVAKNG